MNIYNKPEPRFVPGEPVTITCPRTSDPELIAMRGTLTRVTEVIWYPGTPLYPNVPPQWVYVTEILPARCVAELGSWAWCGESLEPLPRGNLTSWSEFLFNPNTHQVMQ